VTCELNGVDLARQALAAAREAAQKNGATRTAKSKQRTGTVLRRASREPLGPSAAWSPRPPAEASSRSSTTSSPLPGYVHENQQQIFTRPGGVCPLEKSN
jgi:hypothetical protein